MNPGLNPPFILNLLFTFASILLVYASFLSLLNGLKYYKYFLKELGKPESKFTPKVAVVVPCCGIDEGLEENLKAILMQDYPNYSVVFTLENNLDQALPIVKRICSDSEKSNCRIIFAGAASTNAQKLHNLIAAIESLDDAVEILVFADSDITPDQNWLKALISPLDDDSITAATGYRWYSSDRFSLANELRSVWNASVATALGDDEKKNFCWGGSTAIRLRDFKRLSIGEKWKIAASDDFIISRSIWQAGENIKFVPQAMVNTGESANFRSLLAFTNRQMKITRVYAPRLWKMSFFGSGLFCGVMGFGIYLLLFGQTVQMATALLVLSTVAILSIAKSWLRLFAVRLVIPPVSKRFGKQLITHSLLWPAAPPIFLINCIIALFSRKIKWRGKEYLLLSAEHTVICNTGQNTDPRLSASAR